MWGWNLPPGCGMLPGEEEYPEGPLRCRWCGAFVKTEPDTHVERTWKDSEYDPVTEEVTVVEYTENAPAHTCKRCGRHTLNEYFC